MSYRPQKRLLALVLSMCLAAAISWGCNGCNKTAKPPELPDQPTLRLYVLGGAAGAVEPCGCVKDMLGGVDHAAAYLSGQSAKLPGELVVGAGPMLFSDPSIDEDKESQARFKARALAESFKDMSLKAWAPGANDWALGSETLRELRQASGAKLLAGNLERSQAFVEATSVEKVNGLRVGLAGVVVGSPRAGLPEGLGFDEALTALQAAAKRLSDTADLRVALISAPRGDALRLIERVSGFQVLVLGKALDAGDKNDEPIRPSIVDDTLVVQAPNHLQGIATVDLFVRDRDFSFQDGSGVERLARDESLAVRIRELEKRLEDARAAGAKEADLKARRNDLEQLKRERQKLSQAPKVDGSFFKYQLVDVREALGVDPKVKGRLVAYYKRVNAYNKQAFKDKLPEPVPEGSASYLGRDKCTACHLEEDAFWKGTRHAKAYLTLQKDHKEFNLDCVSCHVTAYEKPGGSTVTHVQGLTDVQCEVCHGPGSLHVANPADPKLIQASPKRTLCAQACHHPPHVNSQWSVDAAWQKILGPGHGR